MNKYLKIVGLGVLIWLIPFIVSFFIYPLKEEYNPLFESIMPIVISICVVVFAIIYYKKIDVNYIKEGALIGFIWLGISIIIDLIMFLPDSAMQMTFTDYLMDIGVTYLIIPVITIGLGYSYKT
jgi:hypothetical protein